MEEKVTKAYFGLHKLGFNAFIQCSLDSISVHGSDLFHRYSFKHCIFGGVAKTLKLYYSSEIIT